MPASLCAGCSPPRQDRSSRRRREPLPNVLGRPVRRALVVLVAALSAACQHQPPGDQPSPGIISDAGEGSRATQNGAVLMVQNHRYSDIVVYLVRGGQRMRLGLVRAVGEKTFQVPHRLFGRLGSFHLLADPIGERGTLDSGVIFMRPGARVEWVLETTLETSSLAVY